MTIETLISEIRKGAIATAAVAAAVCVAWWRTLKPLVAGLLQLLAAVILIFEEWGWQPLAAALGWLARFRPIAALERWIAALPPYGALVVFAAPVALLFPLKLVAVWLLANGRVVTATALFIGAKITSTALIARLFMLTKPQLLQIGWFARGYAKFVPWEQAAMHWLRTSWAWRSGRAAKANVHRALWPLRLRLTKRLAAMREEFKAWWPLAVRRARVLLAKLRFEMAAALARVTNRGGRNRVL